VATRLSRPQQVERNRERLLEAAREVFTEAGYAKATLEAIAERAGFSKGVVYSQFDGKADLFLALLERRIAERAEQNRSFAATADLGDVVSGLLLLGAEDAAADRGWRQVLLEFRGFASRDAELNARYAGLHRQTIAMLAALFDDLYERAGIDPEVSTKSLAQFLLALSNGVNLEQAVTPDALPIAELTVLVTRALGLEGRNS
jgi:AcrR family transcriptional regulator